jgi:hypothetical protein
MKLIQRRAGVCTNQHYRSSGQLPTIKNRVMERACANGMTAFELENIPSWQTPIDVINTRHLTQKDYHGVLSHHKKSAN